MTTVTIVQPQGDGSTTEVTQDIPTTPVFIVMGEGDDADELEPAVTKEIEITLSEQVSSVTDQCGRTENRQQGDTNWQITMSGIITNDSRGGNMSLGRLKTIGRGDMLRIRSAIHSGRVIVREISIKQTNDLKNIDVGHGDETAFEFQLQLREP